MWIVGVVTLTTVLASGLNSSASRAFPAPPPPPPPDWRRSHSAFPEESGQSQSALNPPSSEDSTGLS